MTNDFLSQTYRLAKNRMTQYRSPKKTFPTQNTRKLSFVHEEFQIKEKWKEFVLRK